MAAARRRPEEWLAERGLVQGLLTPLGLAWSAIARARAALYDRRLLGSFHAPVPVISIGNLIAGGTGKTPLAGSLAQRLIGRGMHPGILMRGYRAQVGEWGDEALELRCRWPEIPLAQDGDRVRGAAALAKGNVDVILLDDGFQHRRLARQIDIVLLDATRPLGFPNPRRGGRPVEACLPRGLLREPPRALARADLIVLTRVDQVEAEELRSLERRIEGWAPGIPVLLARHAPVGLSTPQGRRPITDLEGRSVDLISGIGNPRAFEATVAALGARIQSHLVLPDHGIPTEEEVRGPCGQRVVTTGKDAPKLERLGLSPWVLEIGIEWLRGESWLDELLDLHFGPPHA